jgi:hypothetical protein
MLITVTLFGLMTAALPQVSFAQSSPLIGTWKLNLEKSKYTPGSAPKSQTLNFRQDGQNITNTSQAIDAQGNATSVVFMHIYDGQPHSSTGSPIFDATAYTRLDANTIIFGRSKAGKLVQIGNGVVSQDTKRLPLPPPASSAQTTSTVPT